MYDPEMRKDCPMRGNLGNCSPVGGFCMDAVSDEICEAVHNAYDNGFYNAVRTLKEQEAVKPNRLPNKKVVSYKNVVYQYSCGNCSTLLRNLWKACPLCGKPVKWDNEINKEVKTNGA